MWVRRSPSLPVTIVLVTCEKGEGVNTTQELMKSSRMKKGEQKRCLWINKIGCTKKRG